MAGTSLATSPPTDATLRKFAVAGFTRLWVLGASRRKSITIYSQQLRALVLSHALAMTFGSKAPERIAIVGGGIGGLTLARSLGAVFPPCEIHIFERKSQLLHLLQGCRTRWLHPTINDWPLDGYESPNKLPFLPWTGGFANAVATTWLGEWTAFCNGHRRIHVHTGVHVRTAPQEHSGKIFLEPGGMGLAAFDLVILAVGFGIESYFPGAESSPSYWTVDTLEQEGPRSGIGRRRILISGVGDGGLIDFARSRIRNFDHQRTVWDFIERAKHLVARLQVTGVLADAGRFAAACASRDGDAQDQALNEWLECQLRTDTDVTLLGAGVVPFASPSASINRALVLRLLERDSVGASWLQGRLLEVVPRGGKFSVRLSGRPDVLDFDEVVIRHGADAALQRDFSEIADLHARNQLEYAGELTSTEIAVACAFFANKSAPIDQEAVRDSVGDAIRNVAVKAGWTISEQDMIATLRWIVPRTDWAYRDVVLPEDELLAHGLAEALASRVPQIPRSKGDLHHLYVLVRLLIKANRRQDAYNIFYDRIRGGIDFRSIYQFGLYAEDQHVLTALRDAWPTEDAQRAALLNSLGYVMLARGELKAALVALQEAERIRSKLFHWKEAATTLINQGEALYLMSRDDEGDQAIATAIDHVKRTSHLGLYRTACSIQALRKSGGSLDIDAHEIWRLPEPPSSNTNEVFLANLCDARLFAGRIRGTAGDNDARRAITHEALQYFGFLGPGRRPRVFLLDRAVINFLGALLVKLYDIRCDTVPSLSEALWDVRRSGDLSWYARCELAAHLADPSAYPDPSIPSEARALSKLDANASPIVPLTL